MNFEQVSKTLWELKDEPNVQTYMADIDNMHKVRAYVCFTGSCVTGSCVFMHAWKLRIALPHVEIRRTRASPAL